MAALGLKTIELEYILSERDNFHFSWVMLEISN